MRSGANVPPLPPLYFNMYLFIYLTSFLFCECSLVLYKIFWFAALTQAKKRRDSFKCSDSYLSKPKAKKKNKNVVSVVKSTTLFRTFPATVWALKKSQIVCIQRLRKSIFVNKDRKLPHTDIYVPNQSVCSHLYCQLPLKIMKKSCF